MIKTLIYILIFIGIFTIFSAIIPDTISANIDGAIVKALSYIWTWDGVIHVSVLMNCLISLILYLTGISTFYVFYWFISVLK